MSIELGGTDKNISYLNLTKSGKEASNDEAETCSVTLNFNTPWLDKQDDYLCAVTRFSVPLSQVPTIKGMSFEVRSQDLDGNGDPRYDANGPLTTEIPCRVGVDANGAPANEFCVIETGDHYTFHGFLEAIQYKLENTYIQATYEVINGGTVTAPATVEYEADDVVDDGEFNESRAMPLSERIKMRITPDFRFQVMVTNDGFPDKLVVKMSKGMFHMCQFQTSSDNLADVAHRHNDLEGFHFAGDPNPKFEHYFPNAFNNDGATVQNANPNILDTSISSPVDANDRVTSYLDGFGIEVFLQMMEYPFTAEVQGSVAGGMPLQKTMLRRWTVHTAHLSCADYSRCREVVFTSDMAVKSEGNSSGGYKRFLCDYQITDPTTFSYTLRDDRTADPYAPGSEHFMGRQSTIEETLPSHRIYQSTNASAGRWQDLTLPSPLYELEVRARVRVWDYENSRYSIEDIPLPAGTQYSVKLIFVSKKNFFDTSVSRVDRFHK
jgi:hypothetical protein